MKLFKQPPSKITLHHSFTKDGKGVDAKAYTKYHVEVNGWDDCGYHRIYERVNGVLTVQLGRDIKYQGAHCPELNHVAIGVCFAGNFDIEPPDDEMLDFAVKDCQDLIKKYNMDINKAITYHCDYSKKSCPGKKFPKEAFILAVRGEPRPSWHSQ